mmetsp:Transcript_7323/g.20553  ORF Transcript_7323/g.20553 Transcript_7323/m.20553 type:complete len:232 (+) Transcript_7323:934-1629(+)
MLCSSGSWTNIPRACPSPRRCWSKAMTVTSSTPAGMPPSFPPACQGARAPVAHQPSLPMALERVPGRTSSSVRGSRAPSGHPGRPCPLTFLGRPSAMWRNPVRASLRVDQRASVFHGVDRPFRGCSPASKTCPSRTGPTTRVSLVWWSISFFRTSGAQHTSRDWYSMYGIPCRRASPSSVFSAGTKAPQTGTCSTWKLISGSASLRMRATSSCRQFTAIAMGTPSALVAAA